MPVKPPPRRGRPDALNAELNAMASGFDRGFPWFPPPPPPVTALELARIEAGKLARREELDPLGRRSLVLLWVAAAAVLLLALHYWRWS